MHGHSRSVERKIRLWIVQQETARRKQARLDHHDARAGASLQRLPSASRARPHRGGSR
jgi:hypothetical protein